MTKLTNRATLSIGTFGLFMALGACAVQPQPQDQALIANSTETVQAAESTATASVTETDPMICTREAVVGSKFKKEVCIPRSIREQQREESRDFIREGGRGSQAGVPGG